MLTKITFRNFRAIQDASIELGPFNVLIGANGSGKSTVVQAIMALRNRIPNSQDVVSLGREKEPVSLDYQFEAHGRLFAKRWSWSPNQGNEEQSLSLDGRDLEGAQLSYSTTFGNGARLYCFDSAMLRSPAQVAPLSTAS
jgi:predicted ATPase